MTEGVERPRSRWEEQFQKYERRYRARSTQFTVFCVEEDDEKYNLLLHQVDDVN